MRLGGGALWTVAPPDAHGTQNRAMLRLAPSLVPLWRTPTSVQFGADPVARIDDVTPWQERLIDALQTGIPDAMVTRLAVGMGATAEDAARFLADIRPALTSRSEAGPAVALELPPDFDGLEATALEDALRGAGLRVAAVRRWPSDDDRIPVAVVAHRMIDPRRAARLASADITHLPIELSGDRVNVGPLIVPGRTGCLACLHTHRREADPGWPLLAAQLLARPALPTEPALLLEAALLAARLLRAPAQTTSMSVSVSSESARRRWRAHRPHAQCLCRSPEGTGSAAAHGARSSATTTATAYARPA